MTTLAALPLETLRHHIAFLGKTGAGKTYAARGAVERLQDESRRVCVIDPTGAWWGLRLAPDGKTSSGREVVILGGDHADLSLEGVDGQRLADLIAGEGSAAASIASAIIDTSRLTVGARTRLFTDFAERLAQVNRRPLHLVIDEAHLFAPQGRVNDPQSGRMVGAANHLVSGGRSLGLRIMLLSQRPAKLHKDSLTQVETLVALRLIAPQDRAAVKAWVGEWADVATGKDLLASLPSLQTGQGWVWAPEIDVLAKIAFGPIATFDSSRAPHDDRAPAETTRLTTLDLAHLAQALRPPPPTGGTGVKAPPPAQVRVTVDTADQAKLLAAAEARGFERGLGEGRLRAANGVLSEAERALEAIQVLEAALRREGVKLDRPPDTSAGPVGRSRPPPAAAGVQLPRPAPAARPPHLPVRPGGADRLLRALRGAPGPVTWKELAVLACMSPTAGYFRAARNALTTSGHLLQDGDLLSPIDRDGVELTDPDQLVAAWAGKLGGAAARILNLLQTVGPRSVAEVARLLELSPTAGYTRTGWKALRNNNLVVDHDGQFALAPIIEACRSTSGAAA